MNGSGSRKRNPSFTCNKTLRAFTVRTPRYRRLFYQVHGVSDRRARFAGPETDQKLSGT